MAIPQSEKNICQALKNISFPLHSLREESILNLFSRNFCGFLLSIVNNKRLFVASLGSVLGTFRIDQILR